MGRRTGRSWSWEQIDAGRSGSSGDLSKLFRNEPIEQPGVLAANAPPADATMLAREVIQNSWDAARDLAAVRDAVDDVAPRFEIDFLFRQLGGSEKSCVQRALALDELSHRASSVDRQRLGLKPNDCLDRLGTDDPLIVLEIRERGASGMYGPFEGTKSKLYLALVSVGITAKTAGDGGSYGFGKAGLIRGSTTRTVIAYTCFEERPDDPGVTRRLLGMTYWGMHEWNDLAFTGFARLGARRDRRVVPFENGEADRLASELGLEPRAPDSGDDALGTTFLLLDPTVDPRGLTRAIERNWWPAIRDDSFSVRVTDTAGITTVPRPLRDDALRPFVRAYEVATRTQDNSVANEYARRFNRFTLRSGRPVELGRVGLVADLGDWSYPHASSGGEGDDSPVAHRSLVALVRSPRMVVDYLDCGSAPPFVRGAFVAHDDVDDLLRQTEPKAHDSWQTGESEEGVDGDAPGASLAVISRVRAAVSDFKRSLRLPAPVPGEVKLPVLQGLFTQLVEGRDSTGINRAGPSRSMDISVVQALEHAGADLIRMRASIEFALAPGYTLANSAEAVIGVRYMFVEDGGPGAECVLEVEPPVGFEQGPRTGTFVGELSRSPAVLQVTTAPYSCDWTGRLLTEGEILTTSGGVTG